MTQFSVSAVFKAVDKISRPIARMQSKLGKFSRKAGAKLRKLDEVNGRIAQGFKRIGQAAAIAGGAAAVAMADVIRTGAGFEQRLTNAAAKFPGEVRKGTEAFSQLEEVAKQVGATTEFKAEQAGQGLEFLAMAGMDAQQSVAALPGLVDLATSAQIDLGRASDVATDSLSAFNLMTEDSAQLGKNLARVNDVIAKTTTSSNTNVEMLFESIKKGAPVATAAGQSLETYAALTGSLASAGIKGSEAGTVLRNTFLNLQATTPKAAAQLDKLGISVTDAQGNMRDVIDILGDFQKNMKGMGTAEQAQILQDVFGKRAVAGVSKLLQVGAEDLKAFRGELEGATGASEKMASQIRDTTQGRLKALSSAVESVKLEIFEVVSGPLSDIVEGFTDWARANKEVIGSGIKDFVSFLSDNSETFKRVATAIGIMTAAWAAYAIGAKAAAVATGIVSAAMSANPVTLIIIAIVAAIALLIAFWPEISAFFEALWAKVVDVFNSVKETILEVIDQIWPPFRDFFVGLFEFYVGVWSAILDFFRPLWEPMINLIKAGAQLVIDNWGPIKAFFLDIWEGFQIAAKTAFGFLMKWATRAVVFVRKIWEPLSEFFSDLWSGIADTFNQIVGPILNALSGVVDFFRSKGRETLGTEPEGEGENPAEGVVSPQERTSRTIREDRQTSKAELSIRDETGRAAFSRAPTGPGINMSLDQSGAF